MVNVNPSFKDLSPLGTWATNNLEQVKGSVKSRAAAPFAAVAFAGDGVLHAGCAIGKGVTVVVFKIIETLGALVAKDMDLSKSTGLTNYTWNETVGHLSRVGSDVIAMTASVVGAVSPKVTVAAARRFGAAKEVVKPLDNRSRARRIYDHCVAKPASWAKANPKKAIAFALFGLGVAYEEYKYGYGMDLAAKSWEYVPSRPEFVGNAYNWSTEKVSGAGSWLGSWVGLGASAENKAPTVEKKAPTVENKAPTFSDDPVCPA